MSPALITMQRMRHDPYSDAIKAVARLAIAAGAEPRHVREKLGRQAICDTTAARRRPIAQLVAQAEEASRAVDRPFTIHLPEIDANATLFSQYPEIRTQFAEAAIEYGVSLRDLSMTWPKKQLLQDIDESLATIRKAKSTLELLDAKKIEIDQHKAEVARYAQQWKRSRSIHDRLTLTGSCQRLHDLLPELEQNMRDLYRTTCQIHWRPFMPFVKSIPRPVRTNIITQATEFRSTVFVMTDEIRTWLGEVSPGPL